MASSKMCMYRSPKFKGVHCQVSVDKTDEEAKEYGLILRAKVRNTPDDREDLQITKIRAFYEAMSSTWRRDDVRENFDSRDKILRLQRRREARRLTTV